MRTRLATLSVISALLCLLVVPLAASAQGTASSLIVKLVAGLSSEEQAAVFARNGGVKTSSIAPLRLHVVEVAADELAAVLSSYRADPQVERVEENTTRSSEARPSDALYINQWALPRIGWDVVYGTIAPTGTATVAVLDTGVDARHPDLAGNVISGVSILDGSDGTTDPSGHGTWLAGIVAANTGSLEGIAGVGYAGVRVMPVTVLDANGIGRDSDIIAGVVWAADRGADVILMSFSATGFSSHLQDALDYAWSKGAVLVAAAGNAASTDPTFPAGHRGVMGVAATDPDDRLAPFSNEGQSVFIAAPGTDIQTTDVADAYIVVSGTSTAAAHVAGVAGFMRAVDSTLSNGVIVGRLARTADPAGAPSQTGNGRINMARALEDTSTEEVRPAGAAPVGEGGPFVGPYVAAAPKVGSVSLSAQSGTLTSGTAGTATYTVTVNRGSGAGSAGTFTATLSVTSALPIGATASFSPNPVSFTPAQTSRTATLTIATTAGTPTGSTVFDVKAQTSATDSATGSGTLTIGGKANQTITFGALGFKTYGDPDFTVSATASSRLTVTFTSTTPTTCTVSAVTVHLVAAGTCTIRASQGGDANFNAAPDVDQSFTIAKKAASVTPNAASKIYGDADPTLTGTLTGFLAGDGVTATYTRTAGETVGTYTISATLSLAGFLSNNDITYNTASFTITNLAPSVTGAAASKIYGDADPNPLTTGTLTGFLAGDGVTATYSRTAGEM